MRPMKKCHQTSLNRVQDLEHWVDPEAADLRDDEHPRDVDGVERHGGGHAPRRRRVHVAHEQQLVQLERDHPEKFKVSLLKG